MGVVFALFFTVAPFSATPIEVVLLDVRPWMPELADQYAATTSRTVSLDDINGLSAQTLLVLPECRIFPASGPAAVEAHLAKGGHLLAAGGPAFETLLHLRPAQGDWMPLDDLLAEVPGRTALVNWKKTPIEGCPHGSSGPRTFLEYKQLENGFAAEMELAPPIGWETIVLPCAQPLHDDNVLRFRVSGSGQTRSLLIEVTERDHARWMAVAPVSAEPREVGLAANAFTHWNDAAAPHRGGPGDQVNFSNIALLCIGLAQSHQPLPPGRYGYSIEDIAMGRLEGDYTVPETPKIEGLSPSYKFFEAAPASYAAMDKVAGIPWDFPKHIVSPVARPMHRDAKRPYTWEPLVRGYEAKGSWNSTPVSTMWFASGATCTYVGFRPPLKSLLALAGRLAETIPAGLSAPDSVDPLLPGDEKGPCVSISGNRFAVNGQSWFANGVNYWPLYVSGLEQPDYWMGWLNKPFYIPEFIERDLDTLAFIGINLVSIQYSQVEEAPQLRDFVARCGGHGIKVNIFLNGAHPTEPSADDALDQRPFMELLRAADLRGNPHVFAYDLAWEPHLGEESHRLRLAPLWRQWVEEQYGSLDRAAELWGMTEIPDGPTDQQLIENGSHRVMAAAYRRFADDLISRRYRKIIRLAKSIDNTHLFGVRTGYGGTGTPWVVPRMPYQLTSGAAHLDFISPEGYGYGPANIIDAAFVAQYARWAGNGKPVFWAELGISVWHGGEPALQSQAALYGAFADMIARTQGAGWAVWWYPGGYRVDESSDYGLVAPDGTPRPATEAFQRLAGRSGSLPDPLSSGELIVVERDATPSELADVIQKHSAAFAAAYGEGRLPALATRGTGTTSLTCPLTTVGGAPFSAPAPPEFLNAEIAVIERHGEKVVLELINTGEAAWDASDCSLGVVLKDGRNSVALEHAIARFERASISLTLSEAATVAMHSGRFGFFGERIRLE